MAWFTRKKIAVIACVIVVVVAVVGIIALNKMLPLTSATYSAGLPKNTQIIWQDFDAFWQAVDTAKQTDGTYDQNIFNRVYAKNRTDGLDNFDKLRYGGGGAVYNTHSLIPFYQSFRDTLVKDVFDKQQIITVFEKARTYYPQAPIPNVRVFMGRSNNGGTITNGDIIVAYEMFGQVQNKDWDKLQAPDFMKQYLQQRMIPINTHSITELIAHEYIHYLQLSLTDNMDRILIKIKMILGKDTLLETALNEGVATFLQSVLTGEDALNIQKIQAYVDANGGTDVFLKQFLQIKDTTRDGFGDWLYTVKTSDGRPSDMGYWVGAILAKKYWDKTANKQRAFMDLIGKKSPEQILATVYK